jgi:CheY-like chemotaxis protein
MMTDSVNSLATADGPRRTVALPTDTQTVAIVNGSPDILALVENVLSAGHYDVVFIESVAHAYSHIKRVQPNLVILCVHFEDADTLQVLSMLKLDVETRGIPVLTYAANFEKQEEDEDETDLSDIRLFALEPGVRMN